VPPDPVESYALWRLLTMIDPNTDALSLVRIEKARERN
jgi:hypothetical protein